MGTAISEIADLFMTRVNDYRLTTIYQTYDVSVFNMYLEPWLLDSITEFDICNQDLTYTTTSGSVEGTFGVTLNLKNKIILSKLMVKYWLSKEINSITQMSIYLQDSDFKTHSAAQNLKAKQDYYNVIREELSNVLTTYDYLNVNWSGWKNQNFDGSS